MSKLIYFLAACFAVSIIVNSIIHLLKLESYGSADLVLGLVIVTFIMHLTGEPRGKDSQEEPVVPKL